MSTYPYTDSFALIRSILILIDVFGIIGSISQLVSGLFALANAQDVSAMSKNQADQASSVGAYIPCLINLFELLRPSTVSELGAVSMLIMALICFTFELIGLLGALMRKVSVVCAFAVAMAFAIVVNCFIGDGGLKLLIILLNLIMTSLSGVFVYMCVRSAFVIYFQPLTHYPFSVLDKRKLKNLDSVIPCPYRVSTKVCRARVCTTARVDIRSSWYPLASCRQSSILIQLHSRFVASFCLL